MSCLHTISKSPGSGLLSTCASVLKPGDGIFLIEDGIYYCSLASLGDYIDADIPVFGLEEDAAARGMTEKSLAIVELVNYGRFVDLCCRYDKIVSWF